MFLELSYVVSFVFWILIFLRLSFVCIIYSYFLLIIFPMFCTYQGTTPTSARILGQRRRRERERSQQMLFDKPSSTSSPLLITPTPQCFPRRDQTPLSNKGVVIRDVSEVDIILREVFKQTLIRVSIHHILREVSIHHILRLFPI